MARDTYIFAGGGTGGHLYPGLAVAEALLRRAPKARVVFACSNRAIDRTILSPLPYAFFAQPTQPVPNRPGKVIPFLRAWRSSNRIARRVISDLNPRAILGLGGFAAGALAHVGAKRGVPLALLNPDIVPGRSNRFLAGKVDVIFTQFASTRETFSDSLRTKVRQVGCPTRPGLREGSRADAIRFFGLDPAKRTLLVFGGSMLATSITEAIIALAPALNQESLAQQWQLLLAVGPTKLDAARQAFSPEGGLAMQAAVVDYIERMDLAYAAADLALSRSGAGTVAELSATATPAVVLPYPHHADRQQYGNIAERVDAGCAVVQDDHGDASLNAAELRETLLPILRDADALARMQTAAEDHAVFAAADAVADWLLSQKDSVS